MTPSPAIERTGIEAGPEAGMLKTDVLGRVWSSAQRRQQALAEFERSGLSAARFAKLVGVKPATFYHWMRKQRLQRQAAGLLPEAASPTPLRLVEAVVGPQSAKSSGPGLVLQLPGGAPGGCGARGPRPPWNKRSKNSKPR